MANFLNFIFLAFAVVATLLSTTALALQIDGNEQPPQMKQQQPANYYIMAVQLCSGASTYTIHGLWPQYNADQWPQFCNSSSVFQKSQVASIWSELLQYWPTCFNDDQVTFLGHEWSKHGTCSGWTQFNYFNNALKVYKNYNWNNQCNGASTCKVHVNV